MPRVSVILIAFHSDRWIQECIRSLADASLHTLHLVLIDNSGNTLLNTVDYSGVDEEILSTSLPLGFAEANNFALMHASRLSEIVLFLNQDTVSPRGWIDSCLLDLDENPELGAVSPLIRNYDDSDWDPSFISCLPDRETIDAIDQDCNRQERLILVETAPAPGLLVRTSVLRLVGPFDPLFGSYYEDYDLCRRIREAGYQVGFCTNAMLRHYSGSTTNDRETVLKRMQLIIRNRFIYAVRSRGERRLGRIIRQFFYLFPVNLIRGMRRTPSSQPPRITIAAHRDILRIISRMMSQNRDDTEWERYLMSIDWHNLENWESESTAY